MSVQHLNEKYRKSIQENALTVFEGRNSWKDRYRSLMTHLEGADMKKSAIAARTFLMMRNQEVALEGIMRDRKLENTFSQALGDLVPRVVDLVRVFYPNLIANDIADIQTMDRMNGEVFFVKPIFTNTGAGVTAGQEVFKNPTNGTYASEKQTVAVGTGDGTDTTFSGTLPVLPVRPGSATFTAGSVVAQDDGNGNLAGTGVTGTINYTTGAYALTYTAAPANGAAIVGVYAYDSEQSPNQIRRVELRLGTLPVTAEPHPLNIVYSTQAELAASAHLNVDIGDVLTNVVASLIKNERDLVLINSILNGATADNTLNFDAAPPSNYSRLAKYAEWEVKLDQAESLIQKNQGRGGVSFVLAGNNAANVIRHSTGFQPSDVVAPIGPHVIGTLRDGTVVVVKVPTMDVNTYVIGFKGYVVGDAATILAEWVPLYATPQFRSYDFNVYQGLTSMYALVNNNTGYYMKGTLSNYAA